MAVTFFSTAVTLLLGILVFWLTGDAVICLLAAGFTMPFLIGSLFLFGFGLTEEGPDFSDSEIDTGYGFADDHGCASDPGNPLPTSTLVRDGGH